MTLEKFTARLNSAVFWREFTFSQTRFSPRPRQQVELADGLVRVGNLAYVLQVKERTRATNDPDVERQWFRRKVLGKATKQIRDTVGYLSAQGAISLSNDRGHTLEFRTGELIDIKKIVVFQGGTALPEDCWETHFHISETVGFIHLLAANDYLGVLDYLRVPEDVRCYFDYREAVLPRLHDAGIVVEEPDILVGYLSDVELPEPHSRSRLRGFVQDVDEFDISNLLRDLLEHVQQDDRSQDYYRILLEFARLPRSVWREFKRRLVLSLDACKAREFCRPFRFTFPATDCSFMIASLDPSLPCVGAEGERMRLNCVQMFTLGAKYAAKSKVAVGLLVSKDNEYFQLDWCLIDQPWEYDARMEELLANSNPFRPVKKRMMDSFFWQT